MTFDQRRSLAFVVVALSPPLLICVWAFVVYVCLGLGILIFQGIPIWAPFMLPVIASVFGALIFPARTNFGRIGYIIFCAIITIPLSLTYMILMAALFGDLP